jgi:NADH-quinone oxidoreductase subunit L
VVADNLLLLFVGWEVMGLCSYLLIGFWYGRTYDPDPKNAQKLPPRYASIKAFMTTRVADVIMLLGIVWFYRVFGTLNFSAAFSAESLQMAAATAGTGTLAIMALLIFAGTVGKSAQFPLHVWLPNAMEGPTPVSAVIHAAAMVSAGVYLALRIFPLIAVGVQQNLTTALVIAGIGAFTALFAATIAVAQDDVKGILAYSTISQLGFMVAAIGIGAYVAAAFHLITHAFFKALLFLGSGSIIHGMEHGAEHVHDHHTDPQDVMNMGGLRHKMPITFWTFVIGGAALSGFPIITAGFWSKDEILAEAWGAGTPLAYVVFFMLAAAALLTAFYTTRQVALVFLGRPRTPLAAHAHESNRFMTIPLILLSIPALFAGFVGVPEKFPILGPLINNNWIHHFVGTTVYDTLGTLQKAGVSAYKIHDLEKSYVPLITSLIVALGGIAIGWMVYGRKPLEAGQEDPLIARLGPLHGFLRNKWYLDEFYQAAFIRPANWFSEKIAYEFIDKGLIDGTLHLIAGAAWSLGELFRRVENAFFNDFIDSVKDGFLWVSREFRSIQTGKIQEYVLITSLMAGALTLLVLYITGFFQGLFG